MISINLILGFLIGLSLVGAVVDDRFYAETNYRPLVFTRLVWRAVGLICIIVLIGRLVCRI